MDCRRLLDRTRFQVYAHAALLLFGGGGGRGERPGREVGDIHLLSRGALGIVPAPERLEELVARMVRGEVGRCEGGGLLHVLPAPVAVAYDRIRIGPGRSLHRSAGGLYRALEHAAFAEHRGGRLRLLLRLLLGQHALDVAGAVLQRGHADHVVLMDAEDVVRVLGRPGLDIGGDHMVLATGYRVEIGHMQRLREGYRGCGIRRGRPDGYLIYRHLVVGMLLNIASIPGICGALAASGGLRRLLLCKPSGLPGLLLLALEIPA